jgi:glyoxylase I family protein
MFVPWFSHVALNCQDPARLERFYTRHFGFRRARVVPLPGGEQIVFLKAGFVYLELFKAEGSRPLPVPTADGYHFSGVRHLAFQVDDVDATLAAMGDDARTVTLGPMDFGAFIPGWKTVWLADPEGNIVEVSQGYVDQPNPPSSS